MKVLRIEIEAPVCSFRYPHFLVGQQVSFEMPPPSTIYGHVASALGYTPALELFRFGYWFQGCGVGNDLEKQHILTLSSKWIERSINPVHREFIFRVNMILYIDNPTLAGAFRAPVFPVVLGRSQDLACYRRIEEVELEPADAAYFESTLLPFEYRLHTSRGITVLMPQFIGPPPERHAKFQRYITLRDCLFYGDSSADFGSRSMMRVDGQDIQIFVDPSSPERYGLKRAVVFHGFA